MLHFWALGNGNSGHTTEYKMGSRECCVLIVIFVTAELQVRIERLEAEIRERSAQLEETQKEKIQLEQQLASINSLLEASQTKKEEDNDQVGHTWSAWLFLWTGQTPDQTWSPLRMFVMSDSAGKCCRTGTAKAKVSVCTSSLQSQHHIQSWFVDWIKCFAPLCSLQERDNQLSTLQDELKQLQVKQEAAVSVVKICCWIFYQIMSLHNAQEKYIHFIHTKMWRVALLITNTLLF